MPSIFGMPKKRHSPRVEEPSLKRMLIYLVIIIGGVIWNLTKRKATAAIEPPEL